MLWLIIRVLLSGLLAFIGADILGCLLNGGRVVAADDGGSVVPRMRHFTEKHTVGNFFRAVCIGIVVGLAHCVPRTTESPWWGLVFFVTTMVMLIAVTIWFVRLRATTRISEFFWYVVLATAIILAVQASVHVMALWWENAVLSWVFFVIPWMIFALLVGFAGFITLMRIFGRTGEIIWQILAILLVVITVIISMVVIPANGSQIAGLSSEGNSKGGGTTNSLKVKMLTANELEQLTMQKYSGVSQKLLTSSLSPHDKLRVEKTGFSDAITYGMKSSKAAVMFGEVQVEILRNPVYGVTVANAIRDKKIGNTRIGSFNGWLDKFVEKNSKDGVSRWCEYRNNDKSVIYVTTEYRRYAATLCTFLERLFNQGVQARQTVENWCLNATGSNNARVGVKADYQYKKDALILAYVTKDQVGSKNPVGFIIGFNIHDKRPEFYGKEDLPKIVVTPPSPTNPPSGTKPSGETNPPDDDPPDEPESTTVPAGTGSPDPTKPTSPTSPTNPYNKDPSLSDNSGKNDDSGPGPDTNNGEGAQYSSKDEDSNSNHMSQEEYEQAIKDLEVANSESKQDGDSTPSYDGGGTVDNNGAAADKSSEQKPKEPELSGNSGNQYWDGSGI